MSTTVNYTGRKVDIALFGLTNSGTPIDLGLRPTALAITGKLKASQNYIKTLLSQLSERKEDPTYGSGFVSSLKSRNITFPIQITQAFSSANLLVLKYLKDFYDSSVPLDERIDKVDLLNYSIEPGGKISLTLQLYTQAGETYVFYLPVAWSR